jgi:hypothetical protein
MADIRAGTTRPPSTRTRSRVAIPAMAHPREVDEGKDEGCGETRRRVRVL